jgi:imidazole glycerol-phosphate synthase subunit HisF
VRQVRVIPVILIHGRKAVKTEQFSRPAYIGDPVNLIRIFNEKEADELFVLDIGATTESREPDWALIEEMASEAFMPVAYGGGVASLDHVETLLRSGVEKVVVNTAFYRHPDLVADVSARFGSQSMVVSLDVKTSWRGGYGLHSCSGKVKESLSLCDAIRKAEDFGAGELMVTSVAKEGSLSGYDLPLIALVSGQTGLPVVANGGASSVNDFVLAVDAGASAVAAGSFFVYYGKHRAVLATYPDPMELGKAFS